MKLSVITINRNNAAGLEKTIQSVLSQTFHAFEYIVIDGASTDGSKEVIERLANSDKRITSWVSEPDTGIYHAMNKGIKMAKGEYIQFLNSGDCLVDKDVYKRLFSISFNEDIIYANQVDVYADKKVLNKGFKSSHVSFFDVYNGALYHSSSFCKRSLFDTYGLFDESYRIIGDYVFFVKALGFGDATLRYVDILISNFDGTGVSSQTAGEWAEIHKQEDERAYKELFSPRLLELCQTGQHKIAYYDKLKKYPLAWFFVKIVSSVVSMYNRLFHPN